MTAKTAGGPDAAALEAALRAGRITVEYQPKLSAASLQPRAFEALARWTREVGERIPPREFILVELGHSLNMAVVAEGIEHESSLEMVRATGCDMLQGFHISRPLLPDEARQWYFDRYHGDHEPVIPDKADENLHH